jgi:TrmH family RNA methyltransferase
MISKNQLKQIKSLHLKKNREESKKFLAEGVKTVKELLQVRPELIESIIATRDFISINGKILSQAKGINVTEVSEKELEQISALSTPNEALAVCHYFEEAGISFDFSKSFSFYLDDIRDPGNFGTIIRLADWFGISQVFCSESSCELYNPKVIQSTMGAFMRVKVNYIPLKKLVAEREVKNIYGAVLNGKNIYAEKLQHGLIVIGNESKGISEENLVHITHPLTIPSHSNSGTESLNAAMASSIIASEFFRQLNGHELH